MKTIYYNEDGPIMDGLAESKGNLAIDDRTNLTDQQIQSETKNQSSGLTKARKNLTPVQDDNLTPEGEFVHPSQLTSNGRLFNKKTKDRRAVPLVKSRYESESTDGEFLPAYSVRNFRARISIRLKC